MASHARHTQLGGVSTKWKNIKDPFALIIGINEYAHATKLEGAVADAKGFEDFLVKTVKVEPNRIRKLHDMEATRKNIETSFQFLWETNAINPGDSIIIFFAGHGCKIAKPKGWIAGGKKEIEGIFPQDVQPQNVKNRTNFPIPDHTIAIWLNILSYKKGNNITVIFDCCYSTSGARTGETARVQKFHGRLPDGIDKDYKTLHQEIPPEFKGQYTASHVFLAACGSDEFALEENGRGKFTQQLLTTLGDPGADKWTFTELMGRLEPIPRQTPQCEGLFRDRIIFSNVLKLGWGLFPVTGVLPSQPCNIEAGSMHGVNEGALFDIYETTAIDINRTKPLCRVRARDVGPFNTKATKVKGSAVKMGFGRMVCSGNALKVYFSPAFLRVVPKSAARSDMKNIVKKVKDSANAEFLVDVEDNSSEGAQLQNRSVVFTITLKTVKDHGFGLLPQSDVPTDPERVIRVLQAASKWKQHLESSVSPEWVKRIHIDFFPLKRSGTVRKPLAPINNGMNQASIVVGSQNKLYGMTIRNESTLNLYVSIVIFDTEDLQIGTFLPWYKSPIGVGSKRDADPPLPSKLFMPIGYGDGGVQPFMFYPPKNGGTVTFVKLYFTTIPMDMGWLEQASPFPAATSRGIKPLVEIERYLATVEPNGATILFPIVQKASS